MMYRDLLKEIIEIKKILINREIQDKDVLNAKEAAVFMGISINTLHQLTSQNKITHYKPKGKLLYFQKKDLTRFLLRNKVNEI